MDNPDRSSFVTRRHCLASALVMLLAIAADGGAWATEYTLPTADAAVVGEDQTVVTVYEDTLYDLAAKYSLLPDGCPVTR